MTIAPSNNQRTLLCFLRLARDLCVAIHRCCIALLYIGAVLGGAMALASADTSNLPLEPTRVIRFTTDEGTWISLDVSPDGRTIIFDLLGDLYTVPIKGGKATRILGGMSFDAQPRFSPDGNRIAFTSDRDGWANVWVADRDGENARQITRYRFYPGGWSGVYDRVASPEWTPDGRSIVAMERLEDYGGPAAQALVEYDVDSGSSKRLTENAAGSRRQFFGPAFGSNPASLYASVDDWLSSGAAFAKQSRIVRIDRTTKRIAYVMQSSRDSAFRPVASPDGRYLVYGARSGDGTGLRVRDLTTDEERWLFTTGLRDLGDWVNISRDQLPGSSFTPDSRFLVTSIGGRIWRVEISSGQRIPIPFQAQVEQYLGPLVKQQRRWREDEALSVRRVLQPAVSPDGTRVAFSALDRVWIADLPAASRSSRVVRTVPWRLTEGDEGEFFPTWSPTGEYVAFVTWSSSGGAIRGGRVPHAHGARGERPERLTPEDGSFYAKVSYSSDGDSLVAVRGPIAAFDDHALGGLSRASAPTSLEIVRVSADGGSPLRVATYEVPPGDLALRMLASGRPQMTSHAGQAQVTMYVPGSGLMRFHGSTPSDAQPTPLLKFASDTVNYQDPIEALLAPDGQQLLVQLPESLSMGWAFLAKMPEGASSVAPAEAIATQWSKLGSHGAHFVGWTARGVPFYSLGNSLFLADGPTGASRPQEAPAFRQFELDLQVPRARVHGSVLLSDARLLTMNGKETLERGDLLVSNGRIAALGPSGSVAAPPGTKIIPLEGKTILPGYVDAHNHVWRSIHWGVHAETEWRLLVDLAFGVTAMRDPTGYSLELSALGEREASGDLLAPRIFSVDGGFASPMLGDGTHHSLDFIRTLLLRWSQYLKTDQIKVYGAGGRRTRQLTAMAARELGLQPTVEGAYNSNTDISVVLDGFAGIEHTLPEVPLYRDIVQLYAQSGIVQTSTLAASPVTAAKTLLRDARLWSDSKFRRFVPAVVANDLALRYGSGAAQNVSLGTEVAAQEAKIMDAGGCVAMGSHGDVPGYGAHLELWLYALGGMPHYDVLRAGTICAARALGREADFGSLEVGKLADLQVLDADPIADIKNTLKIRYVMKNGVLWDASTMDEVWPRVRRFGGFRWREQAHH